MAASPVSASRRTTGWFILHEGLIGVFGDQGLEEVDYGDLDDETPVMTMAPVNRGWLGITDKYWATAMIPPRDADFTGRFVRTVDPSLRFQADFSGTPVSVAAGGSVGKHEPPLCRGEAGVGHRHELVLPQRGWLRAEPRYRTL